MKEIFQGEVFAETANFDSGIRQLMPRYEEILDVLAFCTPVSAHRILDLGCGTGETSVNDPRLEVGGFQPKNWKP